MSMSAMNMPTKVDTMTNPVSGRDAQRKKPHDSQLGLKAMIAVGSLAATLIGADLMARRDTIPAASAAPAAIVITDSQTGESFTLDTQPIPQLVIPQPVARSRSSR